MNQPLSPLLYAQLPPSVTGSGPQPLPFYLALEEHLARAYPGRDFFFMWQVEPTVIFGRNQIAERELDLAYCRHKGIAMWRRRSGGGAVYADMGNIMLSYVGHSQQVATTFADYTERVCRALRAMGLEAYTTGRNDINILGRKVSGWAYYNLPALRRAIVHGTMLYDADLPTMARVLTPSAVKLEAKGVESVRSRVTTIREHLPQMTIGEFMERLREGVADGGVQELTEADVEAALRLERPYHDLAWLMGTGASQRLGLGHKGPWHEADRHLPGVGEVLLRLRLGPDGTISDADMRGDFFLLSDLDRGLLAPLHGLVPEAEAVTRRLAQGATDPGKVIVGMTPQMMGELVAAAADADKTVKP